MGPLEKSLMSLALASIISADAPLLAHDVSDAKSSITMEDVTGDGLKDILFMKEDRVYIQKNLGRGKYADAIELSLAQQRGKYGSLSEDEKIDRFALGFACFFGLSTMVGLGIWCGLCRSYRGVPYDKRPKFMQNGCNE